MKAKMAVCASNLGQLGKAMTLDAHTNNGRVWLIYSDSRKYINYYVHRKGRWLKLTWGKFVHGDMKLPNQLFHCPTFDDSAFAVDGIYNYPDNLGSKYRASYLVNPQTSNNNLDLSHAQNLGHSGI